MQAELCGLQAEAVCSGLAAPGRDGTGASNGVGGRVPRHSGRCGKQGWCGRGLAAVRWSDIASKLAHLERFASSKGPCGVPIAHGVQWLATAGEAFRGVAELLGSAGG